METEVTTHKFTVRDYYKMGECGILSEDDRVELIAGEIIQLPPIGDHHALGVDSLANLLPPLLQGRTWVRIQQPLHMSDDTEPEPDLVLAKPPRARYRGRHAEPADVLLLVEVSDSTLRYDR